jgi:ABC-2 type transport system permease protein
MTASLATPRAGSAVTGTPPLLRASIKHDGRRFVPWIALATALSVSSVLIYAVVFPTQEERWALAGAISANPALGLIFGPAYNLLTADGFNAWRSLALGGFLAGLGAIFLVTRATRAQEDSGQAELLASGVMGRSARLLTAVCMGLAGSALLGVVVFLATVLSGGSWEPSLLLAATMTATGWMFTGVAAVTAQVGSESRMSSSLAVGVLGVMFLLRGFAYAVEAPAWTVWSNPLGWMTETEPAYTNTWWPLLLAVVLTVLLLVAAFWLQARRDFGVGAIPPTPGPARGVTRSTSQLAWRINRGPAVTWAIAFVALGFVFGYFTTSVNDILASDPTVQQFLASGAVNGESLISAFLVTILSLVGILAAVPGVQVMTKLRAEEMDDRVEPVMATATARPRYFGSNVAIALIGPAAYVLIAGTLIAVLASTADIGITFGDALLQAAATVPAVWTVVAFAVAVIGARPKLSLATWVGVVASFVLTILGPTFDLPSWALAISPFWHVPNVTTPNPEWIGLIWISLVTAVFLAVGFSGFRRRDLAR